MWKRMVQGGIVALVLAAVGPGQAFAFCGATIRQAEAKAAQVETSAKAAVGGLDAAQQARLDKARVLIREAWNLRSRGDHAAAFKKAEAAIGLLPAQGSPQASRTPAPRYAY